MQTPAIDALAKDGVVFDHAYSHVPLPCRRTCRSCRDGCRSRPACATTSASPSSRPSACCPRCWRTAASPPAASCRPTCCGRPPASPRASTSTTTDLPPASPEEADRRGAARRRRHARRRRELARHGSARRARFFLFIHFYEPHKPYTPPARYAQYAPYDGEIAYADELVGPADRLTPKRRGSTTARPSSCCPTTARASATTARRSTGCSSTSETIHVPLIVKLPGERDKGPPRRRTGRAHRPRRRRSSTWLHAPVPSNLRGRSLVPLFDGGTITDRGLYAEAALRALSLRLERAVLAHRRPLPLIRRRTTSCTTSQTDPHERRNLGARARAARRRMRGALDARPRRLEVDGARPRQRRRRQRLQALGYVGSRPRLTDAGLDTLPDPKDKVQSLEEYREGPRDGRHERSSHEAIAAFRGRSWRTDPGMADVWSELGGLLVRRAGSPSWRRRLQARHRDCAARSGRAHRRRRRRSCSAHARRRPATRRSCGHGAGRRGVRRRARSASAHELLAQVALARHDPARAARRGRGGQQAGRRCRWSIWSRRLIHYNAGQYAEALPLFQKAAEPDARRTFDCPTCTTTWATRWDGSNGTARPRREFQEELRSSRTTQRARAGLAMLYRAAGHAASPTPRH